MEQGPFGFPPGFTPHRYQRRMPRAETGHEHWPGTTQPTSVGLPTASPLAYSDIVSQTSATTTGTPSPWGSRPVGDPAVRLRCTYRARRRPPTHPLNRPRWTAPRATKVVRAHGFMPGHGTSPVTGVVPTDAHFHRWGLDFKQSSCWPYRAGLAAPRPGRLQTATASLTCCCPLELSPPGKSGDPRTSLRVPPDCVGDTTRIIHGG